MSERKFTIREAIQDNSNSVHKMLEWNSAITESELKRRLYEIKDDALSMSDCISMIVNGRWQHEHGEGKEEPLTLPNLERDPIGLLDKRPGGGYVKEQPDPWEAWVGKAPDPDNSHRWENWADDVIKWIMEMPRGK